LCHVTLRILVGRTAAKNEAVDSSEIFAAMNTKHQVDSPQKVSYQPTTWRTLAKKCVGYEKVTWNKFPANGVGSTEMLLFMNPLYDITFLAINLSTPLAHNNDLTETTEKCLIPYPGGDCVP
jgi:hypothetical protein